MNFEVGDVVIRRYEPRDRAAVRKICCDTADRGGPVERFFSDRELVADLVTGYYTDFEPRTSWVAECDGRVVGYLNGCLNTRRQLRVTLCRVVLPAVVRAFFRGTFFRRQTWRMAVAVWKTLRKRVSSQPVLLDGYPAHFHLNVSEGFRGRRVGWRLAERFLEEARGAGIHGVHAIQHEDNLAVRKFNERLGFVLLGRQPLVMPEADQYRLCHTLVYGMKL